MSGPKGKGRKRTAEQRKRRGRARMARRSRERGYALRRYGTKEGLTIVDGQPVDGQALAAKGAGKEG